MQYQIDFNKVNTIDDIKSILTVLDIKLNKDYKYFNLVENMVKECTE